MVRTVTTKAQMRFCNGSFLSCRITDFYPQEMSSNEQPSEDEEDDESDFPDDQSFASVDDLDGICPSDVVYNAVFIHNVNRCRGSTSS